MTSLYALASRMEKWKETCWYHCIADNARNLSPDFSLYKTSTCTCWNNCRLSICYLQSHALLVDWLYMYDVLQFSEIYYLWFFKKSYGIDKADPSIDERIKTQRPSDLVKITDWWQRWEVSVNFRPLHHAATRVLQHDLCLLSGRNGKHHTAWALVFPWVSVSSPVKWG